MDYSLHIKNSAPDEGQLDVNNFYYDLLLQDEELVHEANKACEDILFMHSKMGEIDESSPAYEPLGEIILQGVKALSPNDYTKAVKAIEELNRSSAGTLGNATLSPATLVALGALDQEEEVRVTQDAIAEFIEATQRVRSSRTEFETVWARMIEDEQPEEREEQ